MTAPSTPAYAVASGSEPVVPLLVGPAGRAAATDAVEEWLTQVWTAAGPGSGQALAAVGSLARGELAPHSDLDLVLVHDGRRADDAVAALAERVWYPLWDSGRRVDHSVRTLADCRSAATSDLAAVVGLLDLRVVGGDLDLVNSARTAVAHDWRAAARTRLPEVIASVRARHARHGELAHLLEPDLKEAHGGLRDVALVRALTAAWLADRPRGEVDAAYRTLLDVRDALHIVTGRGRDRLARQDQPEVAALLGYGSATMLLREVSDAARVVAQAFDSTLRRAEQSRNARTLRVGPRRPAMRAIGFGMFEHDGEAVLGAGTSVTNDPFGTLRAARSAARADLPLAPATVANLASHTPPLPTPWPEMARDLFCEFLAGGRQVIPIWEALTLTGVVEQWIPAWSGVRSVPQDSPVHRHTVDRHSIQAVVEAQALLGSVRRPDLLLVAALTHDLGKDGQSDDHSAAGAPLAAGVATSLGFPPADVAVIERLVAHHLTLAELATRRDPSDPATIGELLVAVGHDADVLDLLRALTIADATAAGPRAWTDQRAALVRELADNASRLLWTQAEVRRPQPLPSLPTGVAEEVLEGPIVTTSTDGGGEVVTIAAVDRLGLFSDCAGVLAVEGLSVRSAELATVDGVAYDRWVVESPRGHSADAQVMTRLLRRLGSGDRSPLRSLRTGESIAGRLRVIPTPLDASASLLEVRAPDRVGLLRDLGAIFASRRVSVHSASIATYGGRVVDEFVVSEAGGALTKGTLAALTHAIES